MPVKNQSLAMYERGQAQLSQGGETEFGEVAFLVSCKNQAEDFLCQPAIDGTQLCDVGYMLEVVVDDGDVANALVDSIGSDGGEASCALAWLGNWSPAATFTAKGEAKQVLDFSPLVARE